MWQQTKQARSEGKPEARELAPKGAMDVAPGHVGPNRCQTNRSYDYIDHGRFVRCVVDTPSGDAGLRRVL